jgi:ribosomal protein S18 acetylase RimI-like enzyme
MNMMLKIRNVTLDDLDEIAAIEQVCFLKDEAATKEIFKERIQVIPDSFLVAEAEGKVAGFINGPVIYKEAITDDLFKTLRPNPASGGHQSVLGLAVHPDFQKQGIAGTLLAALELAARRKNRETVTLTCKQDLIRFYENHGYYNAGKSDSQHGGVVWSNMIKRLK